MRWLICATNTIKRFNRQLHKIAKDKSVLPIDDGLLKMLCLAMMDIAKNGSDGGRAGDDLCPDGRLFR